MESRNPVFARAEGFNGRANAYGNQTYAGNGQTYADFGQADTWGAPGGAAVDNTRMSIESVVSKTGITMGVVVLAAAVTWAATGNVTDPNAIRTLSAFATVGALGGFILAMVNSFKKVVSPPLIIAYAALEGVFVGALSKLIDTKVSVHDGVVSSGTSGVVLMAVVGTFAAVGGTLAAYKFFNIRVGTKFRKWVIGATMGFVAIALFDGLLSMFHSSIGFNDPFSGLGFIMSIVGLALGVFMLILDFDNVERGVAAGLPDRESWRAAFGLTVTVIWIYIELLRIVAALRES